MSSRFASHFGLLVAACVAATGCCSPYAYYCNDGCGGPAAISGRYGDCGAGPSCDGCGPVGPAVACGSCGGAGCGHCDHTLTGLLRSVFTCNAGCGELYWGEWCYDPPDACDPCDCHGNYVGHGICGPTCWQKFWAGVHGARTCPVGCTGGCSACCDTTPACGCDAGGAPDLMDGEIMSPGLEIYETNGAKMGADNTQSVLITGRQSAVAEPYYARHPQSRLARRPGR